MPIELVCLDADVTLWHNETFFPLTLEHIAACAPAWDRETPSRRPTCSAPS